MTGLARIFLIISISGLGVVILYWVIKICFKIIKNRSGNSKVVRLKAEEESAASVSEHQDKKNNNERTLRFLRIVLVIMCSVFIAFWAHLIYLVNRLVAYEESEIVNQYNSENYQLEPYAIKGNAKFCDFEGFSAEITGIYKEEDSTGSMNDGKSDNEFKVEVTIKNHSYLENAGLEYKICGLNSVLGNISSSQYYYIIEQGKEIKVYNRIRIADEGIQNLYITDISVYDYERRRFSNKKRYNRDDKVYRIDTTYERAGITDEFYSGMQKILDSKGMSIYSKNENSRSYSDIYLVNKSDKYLEIELWTYGYISINRNGGTKYPRQNFDILLPADTICQKKEIEKSYSQMNNFGEKESYINGLTESNTYSYSMKCKVICPADPSLDFETEVDLLYRRD